MNTPLHRGGAARSPFYSTLLVNGPAAGVRLSLARSPRFLRVVRSPAGTWDGLDQVDDTPAAGEEIFAYRRVRPPFCGYIDWRDRGRSRTRFAWSRYALVTVQPDAQVLWSTR